MRKSAISLCFFLLVIFISSGCKAQSSLPPEIVHRIQNEIRSRYSVPPQINISIGNPQSSDVTGYDKIVVTFRGGERTTTHDFLVSKDHKTLARLETVDISQDIMSKIDVKGRPVRGNTNAKVTIVNYDDFQCPYCSIMHGTLFPGFLKEYGDKVKIIYKDYPLVQIHHWAMHAAIDANCLVEQNGNEAFWNFADYVHANQKTLGGRDLPEAFQNLDKVSLDQAKKHSLDIPKLQACMQKQDETAVRASMAEGDKLGVDSTPTMFIDGQKVSGALPEEELRAIVDRALAENNEPASATKK